MCSVLSAIIFLLVAFYGNHLEQSYVAGQGTEGQPPPCEEREPGKQFCQRLYPCTKTGRPCCPYGTPIREKEGTSNCRKANAGEPCNADMHCASANCDIVKQQCNAEGKPTQNKTENINGPCVDDSSCDPKQSLVCRDKKCSCKSGFFWSKIVCDRVSKKTFNGTCTADSDCITERQLKCINKKCGCAKDFIWSEQICKAKKEQTECDPLAEVNECTQKSNQMECDDNDQICRCPLDMEFSSATQSCKLQAGKNCSTNNTMDHDRCASQLCRINEAESESTHYTCACPQVDGVTKIWSSDPEGCLTDYFKFACTRTGSSEECRPGTFNNDREGLICKDNLCQCEKGLTYRRGYCVKADLLFNQPCDVNGVRPTCKADADLTCRDVGGGDFRCVCLMRDVTVRNRRETVALTWNADEKKCDLKPPGERCNGAYECRSGDCKVTCQVALPKRQRATSTGTKIRNYVFLIILFSVIVTHF